jgi:HK97 family phage major capsid protein
MTIAENITQYQDSRKVALNKQTEIATKAAGESRSLSSDEQENFDGLQTEVEQLDGDIGRFEKMLASEQATAQPVDKGAGQPGRSFRANEVKASNGLAFAQYVRTLAQADGNAYIAAQIAEKQAGEGAIDRRIPMLAKAAVSGATTTDPGWAGSLAHDEGVVQDFITFLRDQTIIGQFGTDGIPALRSGVEGVPIDVQSSAAAASWVEEGAAKPVTSWTYDTRKLETFKLAAIAVASDELLRKATQAADVMLRDELARAVAEKEDSTFIGTAAGTNGAPAGILNGATKQASDATVGATPTEKFESDFKYLVSKMIAAKIPFSGMVIIMSSSNAFSLSRIRDPQGNATYPTIGMTGGSISGIPVLISDHVGNTVALMAAGEIYLVGGNNLDTRMSSEASLEMNNAPTGSTSTPTGSNLVSMFQTNSKAFLVEERIGWAKRRDAGVVYVTAADYSQANA